MAKTEIMLIAKNTAGQIAMLTVETDAPWRPCHGPRDTEGFTAEQLVSLVVQQFGVERELINGAFHIGYVDEQFDWAALQRLRKASP